MRYKHSYWVLFRDSGQLGAKPEENETQIDSNHPLKKHELEALLVEQLCANNIRVEWLEVLKVTEL
ncbi:hypothetical protein [Argonema galeatum]|uniref:hypothetical protein n=1 Tax=Argonema galeatum TaxID=2942762 RepID=UPI0020134128|nr:hypothetical protein [Argonema galeatum]MCL1468896.1 hypothetical protein [Argonema galeatum A003/A1]